MSDYTNTPIGSGYNTNSAINTELDAISTAIATKMDKSGTTMTGDLDMNSNDILNISEMRANNLVLGGVNVAPTGLTEVELPSQTGNEGKYLTTDGSAASWANFPVVILQDTVAIATANTALNVGDAVSLGDRENTLAEVISGTGTANGIDIIAHDTLDISLSLLLGDTVDIKQLGATTGAADNTAIINRALAISKDIVISDGEFTCTSDISHTLTETISLSGTGTIKNVTSTAPLKITNPVYLTTALTNNSTVSNAFTLDDVTGIEAGDMFVVTSEYETGTATAAQTVINLSTTSYVVGTNRIAVYADRGTGVKLIPPSEYEETNSTKITITTGSMTIGTTYRVNIEAWDTERKDYIAGEILTVHSVAGNVVSMVEFPDDLYQAGATVEIYKPYSVTMENFTVLGATSGGGVIGQRGIEIYNAFAPTLQSVKVIDCDKTGIFIQQTLGAALNNCVTRSTPLFSGFAYGIKCNSNAKITIIGGSYQAGRHGFSEGGTIPNRDVKLIGTTAGTDPASPEDAFDLHANAERTLALSCNISGGVALTGRDVEFNGCTIVGQIRIFITEDDDHVCEYMRFTGCDIRNAEVANATLLVRPINERYGPTKINKLSFSDCNIRGNQTANDLCSFTNDFTDTTVSIGQVIFDNCTITSTGGGTASAYYVFDHSTSFPYIIDEFLVTNGTSIAHNTRLQRTSSTASADEITRIVYNRCTINVNQTDGRSFNLNNKGDYFEFSDSVMDLSASAQAGAVDYPYCKVDNVEFKGVVTVRPIDFSSARELQYSDVVSPLSTTFDLIPSKTYAFKQWNNVVSYGTAAPTGGTWTDGDRIYLTNPAPSGTEGFICVTDGTFSSASDAAGDTDGSTADITGLTDTSDFYVGDYVTISAGMPSASTPYKIEVLRAGKVLTGSIDPAADTSVVGVGTLFTTELEVGDYILVSGETRVVATIVDDLNLTVTVATTDTANDTSPERISRMKLDTLSTTAQTNVTIVTVDPVFKAFGTIAA